MLRLVRYRKRLSDGGASGSSSLIRSGATAVTFTGLSGAPTSMKPLSSRLRSTALTAPIASGLLIPPPACRGGSRRAPAPAGGGRSRPGRCFGASVRFARTSSRPMWTRTAGGSGGRAGRLWGNRLRRGRRRLRNGQRRRADRWLERRHRGRRRRRGAGHAAAASRIGEGRLAGRVCPRSNGSSPRRLWRRSVPTWSCAPGPLGARSPAAGGSAVEPTCRSTTRTAPTDARVPPGSAPGAAATVSSPTTSRLT